MEKLTFSQKFKLVSLLSRQKPKKRFLKNILSERLKSPEGKIIFRTNLLQFFQKIIECRNEKVVRFVFQFSLKIVL